jgi:3-deoxy-D-manno-octulosonate 8-phosphate phosphatase (KDO 8-P phosphatase)
VSAILLDVDGVLTDGGLFYDASGGEGKTFSAQDSYGIIRGIRAGLVFGIVTGRSSPIVLRRASELGICHVWQGVNDKGALLPEILALLRLEADEVLFMGDDMPDREIMLAAGVSVCPRNAAPEIKRIAKYVTRHTGGYGAVREVIDRVLRTRKLLRRDGSLTGSVAACGQAEYGSDSPEGGQ